MRSGGGLQFLCVNPAMPHNSMHLSEPCVHSAPPLASILFQLLTDVPRSQLKVHIKIKNCCASSPAKPSQQSVAKTSFLFLNSLSSILTARVSYTQSAHLAL